MAYTFHMERTDGTLEAAFHSVSSKKVALRVAKVIAKSSSFDCESLIINDKNELTVAVFKLPKWEG